jgi:hypothetical protein
MHFKCPNCGRVYSKTEENDLQQDYQCLFCGVRFRPSRPDWPATGRVAMLTGVVILIVAAALLWIGWSVDRFLQTGLSAGAPFLWIGLLLAVVGLCTLCGGIFFMRQHRFDPDTGAEVRPGAKSGDATEPQQQDGSG